MENHENVILYNIWWYDNTPLLERPWTDRYIEHMIDRYNKNSDVLRVMRYVKNC